MKRGLVKHLFLVPLSIYSTHGERAYPLGCSNEPPAYYDYESSPFLLTPPVPIKSKADYLITKRLGTGRFSDVFEAVDTSTEGLALQAESDEPPDDSRVVIKCLKPIAETKVRRELLVLKRAAAVPNLVRLLAIVDWPENGTNRRRHEIDLPIMASLILSHAGQKSEYFCHNRSSGGHNVPHSPISRCEQLGAVDFLSDYEIRYFMHHLLVALDGLHSIGIFHRDVKPRNILINRRCAFKYWDYTKNQQPTTIQQHDQSPQSPLMLIDLGLADFYRPNRTYNVRVASRHYKSPELLLGYQLYDYSIDMWAVGCILAGLLFRLEPVFRGKDNLEQFGKIVSILGTEDLFQYIERYQIKLTGKLEEEVVKHHSAGRSMRDWSMVRTDESSSEHESNGSNPRDSQGLPLTCQDGLDLVDKLLVYDHENRWTAREAMQHKFFDLVRDRVLTEVQQARLQ